MDDWESSPGTAMVPWGAPAPIVTPPGATAMIPWGTPAPVLTPPGTTAMVPWPTLVPSPDITAEPPTHVTTITETDTGQPVAVVTEIATGAVAAVIPLPISQSPIPVQISPPELAIEEPAPPWTGMPAAAPLFDPGSWSWTTWLLIGGAIWLLTRQGES